MSDEELRPWRPLFAVGSAAALIPAALIPVQIAVFLRWPPPAAEDVLGWFAYVQENPLLGLLAFDLLLMVDLALGIPLALALYVTLRRTAPTLALLGVSLWLVGITTFLSSARVFEIVTVGADYAAAASDAERGQLVAIGRELLLTYMRQGSAFTIGYVLTSVATLVVGIAILRDRVRFGRFAGWVMVAGSVLAFGLFVPGIGVALSLLAVVLDEIWYVVLGFGLWRLARRPEVALRSDPGPGPR